MEVLPERSRGWLILLAGMLASTVAGLTVEQHAAAPVRPAQPRNTAVVYLPAVLMRVPCAGQDLGVAGCTHGPDPAPPGFDVARPVAPVSSMVLERERRRRIARPELSLCDGDGVSGYRVQIVYAYVAGEADRYGAMLGSIRQWAMEADDIVRRSAEKTVGTRRIRFVHDRGCTLEVDRVALSAAVTDDFGAMVREMRAAGYDRPDRHYLVFMDIADTICGIASMWVDDNAAATNLNNGGPGFARLDAGCWSGFVAAHELMHTLGAVQESAPNATALGHCTDEYDVMCYQDEPSVVLRSVCEPAAEYESLLDCNHDDYFHTDPPPGSYLDAHWNSADSVYLITSAAPPPPRDCPKRISEVDDWRRVVEDCDGRIWQPDIIPGEPCSEFEVSFVAPADGEYVFNGPTTELWVDEDDNGVPDTRIVARTRGAVVRLVQGKTYTARSFEPEPGFELVPRPGRAGCVRLLGSGSTVQFALVPVGFDDRDPSHVADFEDQARRVAVAFAATEPFASNRDTFSIVRVDDYRGRVIDPWRCEQTWYSSILFEAARSCPHNQVIAIVRRSGCAGGSPGGIFSMAGPGHCPTGGCDPDGIMYTAIHEVGHTLAGLHHVCAPADPALEHLKTEFVRGAPLFLPALLRLPASAGGSGSTIVPGTIDVREPEAGPGLRLPRVTALPRIGIPKEPNEPNCSNKFSGDVSTPCPDWQAPDVLRWILPGDPHHGCYRGCADRTDWYRPWPPAEPAMMCRDDALKNGFTPIERKVIFDILRR